MKALTRRDLLVCLSLADVSLMEAWRRLIFANQFLLPRWSWRDLLACGIALVLVTAVLSTTIWLGRSTPLRHLALDRWIFLLPLIVFLNLFRNQFPNTTRQLLHDPNLFGYAALLALAVVLLLVPFHRWVGRGAEFIALCLLPFLPIMIVQASWRIEHEPTGNAVAGRIHASSPAPTRFVWIVYDEADWR